MCPKSGVEHQAAERSSASQSGQGESNKRLVPLALVIAVIAVSFAAIFFRKAQPTHPLVSAGIRLVAAAMMLAPVTIRAWLQGRLPRPVLASGALAGLLYGVHFGAWVWALELTTVAAAVTLVTATPVMLAAVALVTGTDRPDRRIWLALGLSAIGMVMIGGWDFGRSTDALVGDLLALLGAAGMAAYLLVVRRLGPSLDAFAFSGVATAVGGVFLLCTAACLDLPIEAASDEALVYLVLAALLPQIVGHGLLTWAVRLATPVAVAVATVGEPVGATLLGWLWLGEAVTAPIALGCAVTLGGVLLATWQPSSETV